MFNKFYPIPFAIFTSCFVWLCLPVLSFAHEPNSYEMTFQNFLNNTKNVKFEQREVTAICHQKNGVYGSYKEITFGSLHFHKTHDGLFELAENGWLSTFGIRSKSFELVSHEKAIYPRKTIGDEKYIITDDFEFLEIEPVNSPVLRKIFDEIAVDGKFEIIEGWSDGKDNVHTRYVVSNSELIAKCLF